MTADRYFYLTRQEAHCLSTWLETFLDKMPDDEQIIAGKPWTYRAWQGETAAYVLTQLDMALERHINTVANNESGNPSAGGRVPSVKVRPERA